MPFNDKTPREVQKKGGANSAAKRWRDKDPSTIRNKRVPIDVSEQERQMIDSKAAEHGLSRTELIIQAVKKF